MEFRDILERVIKREDLSNDDMAHVMNELMTGQLTDAQIGGFLTAMRSKGETCEEVAAAVTIMRKHATTIDPGEGSVVDTCGTGGDGAGTINISTGAAFVAAAAGVRVAKHGNRSVSSQCGSADVLMALGVDVNLSPEAVGQCIRDIGIGFLFAPKLHGAMKHAIGPRRELGVRTLFNMLGPMTNPAGADTQVLGVYAAELTELFAGVLQRLGTRRALIVHGLDALDEITTTTRTQMSELNDGRIITYQFDPLPYIGGFADPESLKGGNAEENAEHLRRVFSGEEGPKADIVMLNGAAAIYVNGEADSISEAVDTARRVLKSGAALEKLNELVALAKKLAEA